MSWRCEGESCEMPLERPMAVVSPSVDAPLPPAVEGRPLEYPFDDKNPVRFQITRRRAIQPYCDSDFYLKVRPRKGLAVLFHSFLPDGAYNEYAVHASCPLQRGEKLLFQRWMWSERNDIWRQVAIETRNKKLWERRINIGRDMHLPNAAIDADGEGDRKRRKRRRRRKKPKDEF